MKLLRRMLTVLVLAILVGAIVERVRANFRYRILRQSGDVNDWGAFSPEVARWIPLRQPEELVINEPILDADAYVAALPAAKRVKQLYIFSSRPLATSVCSALGDLNSVNTMYLHHGVTDEGFQQLKQFQTVREMSIVETRITDKSLPHLAQFVRLRTLEIHFTGFSPKVAGIVARLPEIEEFSFVEDAGGEFGGPFQGGAESLARLRAAKPHLLIKWK